MMRPSPLIALGTLCMILSAVPGLAAQPPSIGYTMKMVERRDPKCPAGTDAYYCAHITFKYPVIERAPRRSAAAAINQAIMDFLLTSTGEARKYKSIDAIMTEFMQAAQESKQPPGPGSYFDERTITVRYQSDRIVSFTFEVSFFSGGLHPQYASVNQSFNTATGAKIRLADVLVPGYGPRLTRIAENAFRAVKGIKPGMTLHDAGYVFFKNDTFALNDNFWIGPKGITFFYNPYEIASYAMGTTELLLPYAEIRDLINPSGLLGPMK
jgi:Protein of unknown function (DUF3298)/Deacetylase PdaC